ncbi:MAG: GHKL domain-containing protein [Clostridia bacterium]|nr:GHKL domain-containing protein [Clostridia bacterium]
MKIDLFKRLRLSFVATCVVAVSVLLVVLFSVLWFINFRNSVSEIDDAMERILVFNEYNVSLPPFIPDDNPESYDEANSLYAKIMVFSVTKDGEIDYQKFYNSYPSLAEVDGQNEVLEEAISTSLDGGRSFERDFRFYRVSSKKSADGHVDYALYDFSTERLLHFRSAFWYVMAFAFAIIAVGLLAYILSDRVLAPVKASVEKGKDLISNASHELKTPLTIIKANLGVIQSEPNSTVKDNEKWLQTIEEQVERTNSLVLDMLELTRLENSDSIKGEEVDLSAIVTSATLSVEALCYEKEISITENIASGINVLGSKENLERLALILLDNAIKYTPDKTGEVKVVLTRNKKNIVFSVINSGEGIKKDDLKFVFERFYKGDRARTQETNKKSFGLGLAIAKTICDKHRAKIECFSEPNKYTEFRVTFKGKKA